MEARMESNSLKQALALYAQDLGALLPPQEECEEVTFSPRFERRMDWLLRSHKQFYYIFFNTLAKQVVSIILVVLLGLTAVTIGVEAIREPVVEFVVEVFEKFTAITIVTDEPQTSQEIVPVRPTYIPAGYEILRKTAIPNSYRVIYQNEKGNQITFLQNNSYNYSGGIDTENGVSAQIQIGTMPGIISEKNGFVILVCSNEQYTFTLIGNIPREELLKMAQSIPVE